MNNRLFDQLMNSLTGLGLVWLVQGFAYKIPFMRPLESWYMLRSLQTQSAMTVLIDAREWKRQTS